jgi:hypothetical protein
MATSKFIGGGERGARPFSVFATAASGLMRRWAIDAPAGFAI